MAILATAPYPSDARAQAGYAHLSITSLPYDGTSSSPLAWVITVRNSGHSEALNVEVQLTPKYARGPERISAGTTYDRGTGVWTIPRLAPAATARITLRMGGFKFPAPPEDTLRRLHAEIIGSDPPVVPGSRVETEAYYLQSAGSQTSFQWSLGDVGVYVSFEGDRFPERGEQVAFEVLARNDAVGRQYPQVPGYHREIILPNFQEASHQDDVEVALELTGLTFAPQSQQPQGVTLTGPTTADWSVGHLGDGHVGSKLGQLRRVENHFSSRLVQAVVTSDDIPLRERCITARAVNYVPAFDLHPGMRENDVDTVCLGEFAPVSEGEIDLFEFFPCVGVTSDPCTSANTLELVTTQPSSSRPVQPEDIIFQISPQSRIAVLSDSGVRPFGATAWSTRAAFELKTAMTKLPMSVWSAPFVDLAVTGRNGGQAPGFFAKRFLADDGNELLAIVLTDTTKYTQNLFRTDIGYPIDLQFGTLGTYVLTMDIRATHNTAGLLTDRAAYTFHVGPIAELDVRDGGAANSLAPAGQTAYTIVAANTGPDAASAVVVTLSNVPRGAEAFASEGHYEEGVCGLDGLCSATWTLGKQKPQRPISEDKTFPTLTVVPPVGVDARDTITARIRNSQPYTVVIDGTTHSTDYFDYIPENNSASIALTPGSGQTHPEVPGAVQVYMFPTLLAANPQAAVVSWEPVELLNRWPVTGYEVHESADCSERPAHAIAASQYETVGGQLYFDSDPVAGDDTCYYVRAVNERGVKGFWSMPRNSGGPPRAVSVSPTALTIAEKNGEDTYQVALKTEPTAPVTVTVTSDDASIATVDKNRLVFRPNNWSVPQTVTVTAVDDTIPNPNKKRSVLIRHAVSGGGYQGVITPSVSVTVTDDDSGKTVMLSKSQLSVAEDGGKDTYTISLNGEPDGTVTINLTSSNTNSVTVSPPTLTFTTDDSNSSDYWNKPRTVTVTGVDDGVPGGGNRMANIRHVIGGGGYGGVTVPNVPVTVVGAGSGYGVTLSETSLTVPEAGSGEYTIVLDAEPSGPVRIALSSAKTDVATVRPDTLLFTTADWFRPQTVTVRGVDDEMVNSGGTRSADILHVVTGGGYGDVEIPDVPVTVSDINSRELAIAPRALTVAGRTSSSYTVALTSRPTGDVIVTATSDDPAEALLHIDGGNPRRLTFTTSNWNIPQRITVRGQKDAHENGPQQVEITHIASGGGYAIDPGDAPMVDVTVTDAAVVKQITVHSTGLTFAEGESGTYEIEISYQPDSPVSVQLISNNPQVVTVPDSLTFRDKGRQTVTVTSAMADDDVDNEFDVRVTAEIKHLVIGFDLPNVPVTVTDNDTAGIDVSQQTALTVTSAGETGSYTLRLTSEPTNDVEITITSGDPNAATVSPAAPLVFTDSNWDEPQTVTVTVNGRTTITHSVMSTDLKYNGFAVPDVSTLVLGPPTVTLEKLQQCVVGGSDAQFLLKSSRAMHEGDLTVQYFVSHNWRAAESPGIHTATIRKGSDQVILNVRTQNPAKTLSGDRTRRYGDPGNTIVSLLDGDYEIGTRTYQWVDVYHSDEAHSCQG